MARAHDDGLADELDAIRRDLGSLRTPGPRPSKIVLDIPDRIAPGFAEAFDAVMIERTTATWEFACGRLAHFVARVGHARVPVGHREDGLPLGGWERNQHGALARPALPPDRVARLDALGFVWDARADAWAAEYTALERLAAREGHARVPQDHLEDGFRLGRWVSNQRVARKRDVLSFDRVARLDALGMVWEALSGSLARRRGY